MQHNKTKQSEKEKARTFFCKRCGSEHAAKKCPAYDMQCKNCDKLNHYAKMCRSKKVHIVNEDDMERANLFVGNGKKKTQQLKDQWTVKLKVEHKHIKFKLDSGAQANVIPYKLLQSMGRRATLRPTKVKLFA